MCVAVTLLPGAELTQDEIVKMGNANGDGFGFAWAEGGVVNWWKSISYDADYFTWIVSEKKEFPRFVHFRLSTVGGIDLELCHPFEVGPNAACAFRGTGNKVLMHNGHWSRAGDIFDILKKEDILPDKGPWSDTRIAAFLASYDEDWLTTVTGKVATLDGDGNIKLVGYWDELRSGIKVSNKVWESHTYDYKKTGIGRRWEGWGWSDKHWMEKEAYEKAKKEAQAQKEAAEAKKEKHESSGQSTVKGEEAKTGTGQGQGDEQPGVGVQGRDVSVSEGGGRVGGRRPVFGPGSGQAAQGETSGKEENEQEREAGTTGLARPGEGISFIRKGAQVYDLTPWFQSDTGIWWQVDPHKSTEHKYVLRKLSDAQAHSILEQIAAASGQG